MTEMSQDKNLKSNQQVELIKILEIRFENNMNRHKNFDWNQIKVKLCILKTNK